MKSLATFIVLSLAFQASVAQGIQTYALNSAATAQPPSNSIDALVASGDSLWIGTSKGLGLAVKGSAWKNFTNMTPFDDKGISAIATKNGLTWTAIGYSVKRDGDYVQTGGGLNWSSDGGTTWTHVPQPVDVGTVDTLLYGSNKIPALAITVPQQNITFDVALAGGTVWIASFAGMLRKSTDFGITWNRVVLPPDNLNSISPTDTLDFDLSPSGGTLGLRENLNHRVFSVYASNDSTLWAGTAAGINRSTDGGTSWTRFSHQNQASPISGNFVVAINGLTYQSKNMIWAATVNALGEDEQQGVSFSDDLGLTWSTTLLGERAHNISFKDSIVYVGTDRGVFRSGDYGESWILNGTIVDQTTLQRFSSSPIYAVAIQGDTVWVGGPDGMAYTLDGAANLFGATWKVFRTSESVLSSGNTYSYPSPFSPDDEIVRIHYALTGSSDVVTIRIFDFSMHPVRTLIQNAPRQSLSEYDEIWDGRTDNGSLATNGVYFYRVQLGDKDPQWGKIFVIR